MSKNNPRIKTKLLKSWKTSDIRVESNSKGNWVVLGKKRVELPKGVVGGRMILKEAEELLNFIKSKSLKSYSNDEKERILNDIFLQISLKGYSVRRIFRNDNPNKPVVSQDTFYEWLKNDTKISEQYARACEARADTIFEEILEIADKEDDDIIGLDDGEPRVNHDVIQRDRLRVDTRKWILSKMNPKKYGDKIDHTTDGEKIESAPARILTKAEAKELFNSLDDEY